MREWKTIQAMVEIYCREKHGRSQGNFCRECQELLAYAQKRLAGCPFQSRKPTCGKCPIHCYNKNMKERVREVMRFSGPRMIRHHPVLALLHLLDGLRQPPTPCSPRVANKDSGQ